MEKINGLDIIKKNEELNHLFNKYTYFKEESLEKFKTCRIREGLNAFETSGDWADDVMDKSFEIEKKGELSFEQSMAIQDFFIKDHFGLFIDIVKSLKDNCDCKAEPLL